MPRFSEKSQRRRLACSAAGRLIAAFSLGSLLLLSCATIPPAELPAFWLDVLPPLTPDSIYASVDVPSSWVLLQALAKTTGNETEELQRLTAKLDRVHTRIRLSRDTGPELSLIALGRFSSGSVARRLNADPSWQRVTLEPLPAREGFRSNSNRSYRTYWRKGAYEIAVPARGILFVSAAVPAGGDRAGARLKDPRSAEIPPAGAEVLLRRLLKPETQPLPAQTGGAAESADIFIYIPDPAALAAAGSLSAAPDAGVLLHRLPISQGWIRGERADSLEGQKGYELEVVFLLDEVDNPRSVELLLRLVLTLWLRTAQVEDPVRTLKAVTFRADSESVRVESLFLGAEEIASFLRTLLPENLLTGGRP